MIAHEKFQWVHLPRSGGTATAEWARRVRNSCNVKMKIDNCADSLKHDNLTNRRYRDGFQFDGNIIAMNFRSLPAWLESNFKWTLLAGFKLPIQRYLRGEFFSFRMGRWCPADWWLEYFAVEKVTHFFRCTQLENDWRQFLETVENISIPVSLKMEKLNEGPDPFKEKLKPLFVENCKQQFERNPLWELTERKVLSN